MRYNSNLYRVSVYPDHPELFQFLYGTIQTASVTLPISIPPMFQFLYGTIQNVPQLRTCYGQATFNSYGTIQMKAKATKKQ